MIKKIAWIILIILLVIQFIHPGKNIAKGISANDITLHYAIPNSVQKILATACYNCHSNNSTYPWYFKIQPVGLWMAKHIRDGKRGLNFSEFATYAPKKASHKLAQVADLVKKKEMPLKSYLWEHPEARLSPGQANLLINWADSLSAAIKPL